MIKKLDNGIRIVYENLPDFNSVSVGIWVKTGSVCETEAENGISHFIEHMMFKGTQKRTAKDIAVDMDKIGGQINAFTSKECTCYHARVVPDKFDVAVGVLADLFSNSVFDETEMEKEKGVVLEEIAMVNDNVEELAHEKITELFFEGSKLSQPILGTEENIMRFTQSDLFGYVKRHYYPENIIVAVAGKFDEEEMLVSVEKHLGGYTKGVKKTEDKYGNGHIPAHRSLFIEKDVEQTHLCISFPGVSYENDDRFDIAVMNNVLGGGMSSRLFQKIREEKGLAYAVYSYPSSYSYDGMFTLYGGTTATNADTVTRLMFDEIDMLKKNKIGDEEFVMGKDQLLGNYVLSMESTNAKMSALGKTLLLQGEEYDEADTIRKIKAVSNENVSRLIDEVFDYTKMSAVFTGKINKKKEIQKLLGG